MIEWLKSYGITVVGVSVVILALNFLLPEGNIKKYARYSCACILTLCLVYPVFGITDITDINIDDYTVYYDYTEAVTSTVHGISGFENASVKVGQDGGKISSVTVEAPYDKLLRQAERAALSDYLKKCVSALYNVDYENIRVELI